MLRICSDCGDDYKGGCCQGCGCEEYDDISADELEERRQGGLDKDC